MILYCENNPGDREEAKEIGRFFQQLAKHLVLGIQSSKSKLFYESLGLLTSLRATRSPLAKVQKRWCSSGFLVCYNNLAVG